MILFKVRVVIGMVLLFDVKIKMFMVDSLDYVVCLYIVL